VVVVVVVVELMAASTTPLSVISCRRLKTLSSAVGLLTRSDIYNVPRTNARIQIGLTTTNLRFSLNAVYDDHFISHVFKIYF